MNPLSMVPSARPFGERPANSAACTFAPPTTYDQGHAHQDLDINSLTGRIRPISAEEWLVRQEDLTRRLAEIDAEDETPDETYNQFMRNLDEERRRQGRPTAFEGD